MKYTYQKGDLVKIDKDYNDKPSFYALIINITDFYGSYKTVEYKRMDNSERDFCGENYITELIPPIPHQAPTDECIGEPTKSI